jgi:arylsulfatase A-like enzyme
MVTPNLDRLASRGTSFTRTYCQQALCNPSRNSVLSGTRPDAFIGRTRGNFYRQARPELVSLPQHFKNNGYFTRSLGKILHHNGMGRDLLEPQYDPVSWSEPMFWPKGGIYALREDIWTRCQIELRRSISIPKNDKELTEMADVPDGAYRDGMIAEEAIRTMRRVKDQPFFLAVGFFKPHTPFNAPTKYWELYDPSRIILAGNPEPPVDVPSAAMYNWEYIRSFRGIPDTGPISKEKARHLIHGYYAAVSYMDAQLGRVLDELERLELDQKTVIVLWSDHGYMLGEHGIWGKHTNFEMATLTPMIVSVPGQKNAGGVCDALTELVDIYPTLCELCDLPLPDHLEGTSFAPLMENPQLPWKRAVFSQYPRQGTMGRSMRTERYRYTEWRNVKTGQLTAGELYDHSVDPGENENRADHVEFAALVKRLSTQLSKGWRVARPSDLEGSGRLGVNKSSRPNIIFLLTDDQRDNTLGAMGHPFVKTPNLDRLLSQSVRFTNTYIAEPVCAPSRVSLLTGMHERVHGVGFTSSYMLTEEQWERSYPALLRKAGYHTGFVGKFGVEHYTFKGRAAEQFDFWWGHDGWTKFLPKDFSSPSCKPYHGAEEDLITFIMGEAMAKFLNEVPADKPFCLSVSFNVPHGSQTTSMYPDYPEWQQMTRPANENPKLKGTPFYDSLYRDVDIHIPEETGRDPYRFIPKFIMDQDEGRRTRTYQYSYTRATSREHHIRYYQTISGLDQVIGRLLDDLENRGLAQNTVILYGSDHGLLMGEYGMGGKALLYDLASKIPCFVFDPSIPSELRGRRIDRLVSSLNIPRTILDYGGVSEPEFMQGESLRPLVKGEEVPWREELFLESLYTGRDTPFQEGIRLGQWKYIRMYDGKTGYLEADVDFRDRTPEFEMLFDLKADPREMNNLISEYADTEILAKLRRKVVDYSHALNERRDRFKEAFSVQKR